jgi:NAD(P)-dependent dehydrogenase (short-subunit alcohol dehydrogenase family)
MPNISTGRGAVIITGASSGIGAATARLVAASGYAVCVNYRSNENAANEVVSSIEDDGGRAVAIFADVTDPENVSRLFASAQDQLGELKGLVNNAAILETQTNYAGIDAARLQRILNTNVIGAFLCAKEAAGRMSKSNGGSGGAIVNISSIAARTGSPNEYIDYATSKGALDTMTMGLAKELAHDGVRVNCVRPGLIETDMHAKGGEPDRIERLKSRIPLGRGGRPEEVAQAILWLLSEDASFTTGAFVDVGGGV